MIYMGGNFYRRHREQIPSGISAASQPFDQQLCLDASNFKPR